MRLHVVALPHTQTTADYSSCAYTQKVRKFCRMMLAEGHEVFLYSGHENDTPCTQHIKCISAATRKSMVAGTHYTAVPWNVKSPGWQEFNRNAIKFIKELIEPRDFICVIGGVCHKPIADAFPEHMTVEFGIGYGGTFAKYRVFESYTWMHTVYGQQQGAMTANGNFYDAVIPNYFDIDEFPYSAEKGDYFLYLGRLIQRKGVQIAADTCKRLGERLLVAGFGPDKPSYGELVGEAGPIKRGLLMSKAKAVFVPTMYLEPFGGVAVEAMLCGTPVITTDWGAFTETVKHGETGFRCHTLEDFCTAAKSVGKLKPHKIANYATDNYSMKAVAPKYTAYFERLMTLWDKGWYS